MLKKNNKLNKDERGIILVLAIMMMAVLFDIAVGFALFILSDIRQASQIDNSVLAYYGAEAGLERSLFLFRKMDKDKIGNFSGDEGAFSESDKNGGMANGATWTIENSTDYEPNFLRQRLYNGQSVKLYFLNRTGEGPKSINISWNNGGTAAKLQVIFTQLSPQTDSDGVLVYYSDKNEVIGVSGTLDDCQKFENGQLPGNTINSPSYVAEIRSLGTSNDDFIEDLRVSAFNSDDCTGDANSQAISNITLRSVGNYHNAQQQIIAQIPPRDPVSGLLGYVLFSEEDITKGY